jgi:predicted DNA-binding transcriptional regulator AlpA
MQTVSEPHRPELVPAEEMRAILGIGRSAFYNLARRDELPVPTVRVGKRLMFSRRAVEELLNRRRGDSPHAEIERGAA